MSGKQDQVKIIECPRDAMQGIHGFISTEIKSAYINELLKAGFDTIDFGSFVSPKAIPQMRDTEQVLTRLDLTSTKTKLLGIVANARGAQDASRFDEIKYLGFPFSISETFQLRNTNSTIEQSLSTVEIIQDVCKKTNKELVIYISMAFGNPYGDEWNSDIASEWISKIAGMEIKIIALADTVGLAKEKDVEYMFKNMVVAFPEVEFGAHLHCKPDNWEAKTKAAYKNGCRRFDVAIKGYGGCPMAEDELIGNLATENLIQFLERENIETGIDKLRFNDALRLSASVFKQVA